ncbi:hypothetical protein RB597_005495 [Gaeumannomyces tritici]
MPPPQADPGSAWTTVSSRRRKGTTTTTTTTTNTTTTTTSSSSSSSYQPPNKQDTGVPAAAAPITMPPPDDLEAAVDEISATYTHIRDRWLAGPAYAALRSLIRSAAPSHAPVTAAVCLGNGPLHAPDSNWDRRRTAHVQTVALLALIDLLSEPEEATPPPPQPAQKIRCVFQEPEYTPADVAFIERMGHVVVEDPAAFDMVSESGLLWGVHMYHEVYSRALGGAQPAMFVGTKWTTWDEVPDDDGTIKDSLAKVARIHQTYDMLEFPPDEASFSFGDTCIYWRKAATAATRR